MGEASALFSKRSGAAYATGDSRLLEYSCLCCVHGQEIGAKTIDLEWVQVHPTGLVKPDDADAKIKFLAAEAVECALLLCARAGARPCFCVLLGSPGCGRHHPQRRGQALLQRAGPPGDPAQLSAGCLRRCIQAPCFVIVALLSQAATMSPARCGRASRPSGIGASTSLH